MNVSEAQKYLSNLPDTEERIAFMVVREKEFRQIVGEVYSNDDIERLSYLLSRIPTDRADIDANYWYEHRTIFRELIECGVTYLRKVDAEDRITKSNDSLAEELGLKNIILSCNNEIRPLGIVSQKDITIRNTNNNAELLFHGGVTWGTVLQSLDKSNENVGDHIFLEDFSWNAEDKVVEALFGS